MTPDPTYLVGTAVATVTIADNELPAVTGVVLNPHPDRRVRGVGEIDPSGLGVKTVRVTFSEDVLFVPAGVTAEKVEFDALGNETGAVAVVPASVVAGDTAAEMVITFADAWQTMVDTWVRITLLDTITDSHGHGLDGEPAADSSGRHYICDAALDLPSGNGFQGGGAVFYVGSLRADTRGFGPIAEEPNGTVDSWDIGGFTQKYLTGDLDVDFRGFGPVAEEPNGAVDSWDINGFTSCYTAAIAAGARLGDLPTSSGQGMAAGAPAPLPLLAEPRTLRLDHLASAEVEAAIGPHRPDVAAASPADRDRLAADLLAGRLRPVRQPTEKPQILQAPVAGDRPSTGDRPAATCELSPGRTDRPSVDDVPEFGDAFVDLLALPALDLPALA